jgi:PPK2 family polyphosphate:nucleotide phosphotransferase
VRKLGKEIRDVILVEPGTNANLAKRDPAWKGGRRFERLAQDELEAEAREDLRDAVDDLAEAQELLWASDTWAVLVIFQALDAAGKDGTIEHVMSGVNPQGVHVSSFKQPSAEELDHDFLWRCAIRLPERGRIGIFNRSYYEEVLVVRVHPEFLDAQRIPEELRGKKLWAHRYQSINAFERHLTRNGTKVVKFFLNVSKEEQKRRFLARLDEPDKNWKFSPADVAERAHWDAYQEAYEAALTATSTPWAPWYVIPADHKWFARACASAIIANALIKMGPKFPKVSPEAHDALMETKGLLEAEAPDGAEADPFEAEQLAKTTKADGKKSRKKSGKKDKKSK